MGYGMGFGSPLPFNGTIVIKFAFTLEPTNALFPKLNKAMPGLKTGDSFQADIESRHSIEGNSEKYIVHTYIKQ